MAENIAVALSLAPCEKQMGMTLAKSAADFEDLAAWAGHKTGYIGYIHLNACASCEVALHESYHVYQLQGLHGVKRKKDILAELIANKSRFGILNEQSLKQILTAFNEVEASRYAIQTSLKLQGPIFVRYSSSSPGPKSTAAIQLKNPVYNPGLALNRKYRESSGKEFESLIAKNSTFERSEAIALVRNLLEKYALPKVTGE